MSMISNGTLGSEFKSLKLDGSDFDNLSDLTLIVEEFGQDADSEFAGQLIEVGRRLELAEDCLLKVGGIDAKEFDGKIFILNDLILVGKYKKAKRKRTMSTKRSGNKIIFGAPSNIGEVVDVVSDSGQSKSTLRGGVR